MATPRSHPNFLAGPYLNRAAEWRKDQDRLRAAAADPTTLLVPVWRTRSLVIQTETSVAAHFLSNASLLGNVNTDELILLGEFRTRAYFAVELDAATEPSIEPPAMFRDLRGISMELSSEEAGILAYARAMITWRERHRFCGRCGSRSVPLDAGHVLRCGDPSCGNQQFPRIDPAIIVLIHDGERALLGRQAGWPEGHFSTIAGFVEPGESMEDAVAREVREETGVAVDAIEYHSSQPWPFPSSLMIGFLAHAASTEIDLGDAELAEAHWFTRAQIANGEVGLPFPHSIAFRLVEEWYDAGSARPLREEPNARRWARSSSR